MMFCVVSTFLSIAFIFLVQLYYAVAPGLAHHSGPPPARPSLDPE